MTSGVMIRCKSLPKYVQIELAGANQDGLINVTASKKAAATKAPMCTSLPLNISGQMPIKTRTQKKTQPKDLSEEVLIFSLSVSGS